MDIMLIVSPSKTLLQPLNDLTTVDRIGRLKKNKKTFKKKFYLSSLIQNLDGEFVLLSLLSDESRVRIDHSRLVVDVELALLIAEDDVVEQLGVKALIGVEGRHLDDGRRVGVVGNVVDDNGRIFVLGEEGRVVVFVDYFDFHRHCR